MKKIQLLLWATKEMDRQFNEVKPCSICEREPVAGVWDTCDVCHVVVCDRCAVQKDGGHYCQSCKPEHPFWGNHEKDEASTQENDTKTMLQLQRAQVRLV